MRKKENVKKDISKLIENEIFDKVVKVNFGKLSKQEVDLVKAKAGINLEGYSRIIDNSALKHTLKHHGDEKTEKKRGQIAVVKNDFLKIPKIVETKNIVYTGVNKRGLDTLLYMKKINEVYYFVQEVRTKRKVLALVTMYKKKA